LKTSLSKLIKYLRTEDKLSIIVYSGKVMVPIESQSAKEKDKILNVIDNLTSSGSTLSKLGLQTAYQVAARNYVKGGNNRIIMATDGEFTIDPLYVMVESNAKRQISLSIFSFGKYNAESLSKLAVKGEGNYVQITDENIEIALLKEAKSVRKLK